MTAFAPMTKIHFDAGTDDPKQARSEFAANTDHYSDTVAALKAGVSGLPLLGQGAGTNPSFAKVGTTGIANDAITNNLLAHGPAGYIRGFDGSGAPINLSPSTLGAGKRFSFLEATAISLPDLSGRTIVQFTTPPTYIDTDTFTYNSSDPSVSILSPGDYLFQFYGSIGGSPSWIALSLCIANQYGPVRNYLLSNTDGFYQHSVYYHVNENEELKVYIDYASAGNSSLAGARVLYECNMPGTIFTGIKLA